ncbi:MAG: hypothetical protein IIY21_13250 [Clostridiales bacterium]|nr:hypothetical protein [Clostridiales bacterium]MBQ1572710.1 hypothetical protein [Clostridiales bacterium]
MPEAIELTANAMGDSGKVMILPRGEYSSVTPYEELDCVYYQGRSYLCKQASTGHAPTDTTYWQPMTPDSSAEIQALTNYVADTGVKNLLPNRMVDIEGVTRNADGSITINGTFTSAKYVNIDFLSTSVKYLDLAGLVGVPLVASVLTTAVTGISGFFGYFKADNSYIDGTEVSTSASITYPNDATYARTYIRIKSGTYNNVIVYPMLRDASITDPTYQPYAKTNVELTADALKAYVGTVDSEAVAPDTSSTVTLSDFGNIKTVKAIVPISVGNMSDYNSWARVIGTTFSSITIRTSGTSTQAYRIQYLVLGV